MGLLVGYLAISRGPIIVIPYEQVLGLVAQLSQPSLQGRPSGVDAVMEEPFLIVALVSQPMGQVEQSDLLIIAQQLAVISFLSQVVPSSLARLLPGLIHHPGSGQLRCDLILCGPIEHRRDSLEPQSLCSPAQVSLQDLANIHAARHTQGVQDQFHGCAVSQEGHVLRGHHFGDDALVTVAAGHLVTPG